MRVLVCGGAGFIGSHLVDRLLAEGHSVDVADDLSTGSLANLSEARSAGGEFKFHHIDLEHPVFTDLVLLRKPEVIYQLTSLTPDPIQPATSLRSIAASLAVLEAARRVGEIRVVTALPAGLLYGEIPAKELPVKETHAMKPFGVAGVIAKALLDLYGVYRETYGVEYVALAMSHAYGSRQRPEDSVVANFAHCAVNNVGPVIYGTGKQTRDFLYVDDAIDALGRAGTRGGGLLINIGTGKQTSVQDLWKLIGAQSVEVPKKSAARPTDLTRCCVSPVRAKIHLGWEPWTKLSDGIQVLFG